MLYQLAYISQSRSPLDQTTLSDILEVSQRNNARDRITGVLKYHDSLFFQVLEGEQSAVEHLYHRRISRDARHSGLSLMWYGSAEQRTFSDWAMEYAGPEEVGRFTKASFRSLNLLKSINGFPVTSSDSPIALMLAQAMFRDVHRTG